MGGFFEVHSVVGGLILLFLCALFPRFTLFFACFFGAIGASLLGLVAWLIAPHLLVAILATMFYADTNPILVILAWIIGLAGTGGEGTVVGRLLR